MVVPVSFRQTYRCEACGEPINANRPSLLAWIAPKCPTCPNGRVVRVKRHGCVILESGEKKP